MSRPTLYVALDDSRAEELANAFGVFAPEWETLVLPGWDCLPYDRAPPSRSVMGRRMRVLATLASGAQKPRFVITTPEAVVQRVPPAFDLTDAELTLSRGQTFDRSAFTAFAERCGYLPCDRVDEPGDAALRGEVLDVYPPGGSNPYRLRFDADDVLVEIDLYDPLTQRSGEAVERVVLGPASEILKGAGEPRLPGEEHRLAAYYGTLRTLFDVASFGEIWLEDEVRTRAQSLLEQIADAFAAQGVWGDPDTPPLEPEALYLSRQELDEGFSAALPLSPLLEEMRPAGVFARARDPGGALIEHLKRERAAGRRLVLCGQAHELAGLKRAYQRGFGEPLPERASWAEALSAPGAAAVQADLDAGFTDPAAGVALVAACDVYGGRVVRRTERRGELLNGRPLQVGDVVIHEDHGLGVLRALERVELEGRPRDVVRLEYAGGADVLAPVAELARIWRYGVGTGSVALDRLKGEGWNRRRAAASRQIKADAEALVAEARRREEERTAPVIPPKPAFARFCARFAYPETPDQRDAIAAVLDDLASGRPMDRLVCGDVGFGKTEVALRAAAAVLLSGRQVAVAAPTTVLVRQHLATFERRFAGFGIRLAQLSRLSSAEEVAKAKVGLASGEVQGVIGTHALAADDVAFADLALMILDEEQKFGARLKSELRNRAPHRLSLSATPIPRTLQAALLGAQDVSVIADPPAKRRPVRTVIEPFSAATVHTALLREARRGGQSFVVAPRIGDLDPLREQLQSLTPTLKLISAHGDMAPEAVDEAMAGFAEGRGDVLVATNIIESGLDVPRANTMMVVGAERFGLAQLHQLRGRVGRGRTQGVAYLFTDPGKDPEPATLARLTTLQALDQLGAGLELAEQDLDLRGAGDLTGEDQKGHIKLIGANLYEKMMQRALRSARGETLAPLWSPQIHTDDEGLLDEAYVPDDAVRLTLYARLAGVKDAAALKDLTEEIEDRFGPLPPATATLLQGARLRLLAKSAGAASVRLGPKAAALVPRKKAAARFSRLRAPDLEWKDDRLILQAQNGASELLERTLEILQALSAAEGRRRPARRPPGSRGARASVKGQRDD